MTVPVTGREAAMGSKDKAKRSAKKAPARSLKDKRLAKKAKRAAGQQSPGHTVDKAFDR